MKIPIMVFSNPINCILGEHIQINSCHKFVFMWPEWECGSVEEGIKEENNSLLLSGILYSNCKRVREEGLIGTV